VGKPGPIQRVADAGTCDSQRPRWRLPPLTSLLDPLIARSTGKNFAICSETLTGYVGGAGTIEPTGPGEPLAVLSPACCDSLDRFNSCDTCFLCL
jgi:hypothetical protein